jgi:hypothetical protein
MRRSVRLLGSPPIWKDTPLPFSIPSDKTLFGDDAIFEDHGAGMGQSMSILAMLAAIKECSSDDNRGFEWSSADIISDRNSLRKLLRWVGRWNHLEDFRIDMHLVGNKSVVFTRWWQDIEMGLSPGSYGLSFEHHGTHPAPGCEVYEKAAHNRVITYVSKYAHICTHRYLNRYYIRALVACRFYVNLKLVHVIRTLHRRITFPVSSKTWLLEIILVHLVVLHSRGSVDLSLKITL